MPSEHGAMPIPAPAVVELLRGAPLYSKGVPVELVTPTGAAILSSLVEGYGELPPMRVGAVGYGASFEGLAALLGMLSSCAPGISVVNIDNGFGAAHVARRILRAGREG